MEGRLLMEMRLYALLWMHRYGWMPLVTVLLSASALWLHFLATPDVEEHAERARQRIRQIRAQPPAPPPLLARRYDAFRSHLADVSTLPEVVRVIFASATQNEVPMTQAQYKLTEEAKGGYSIYRLTVPVKGRYADVRRFADAVLERVPPAALDEISFKRDAPGASSIEAHLHFSVYLKNER
jgi:Tfp pilus assembly protein PilO